MAGPLLFDRVKETSITTGTGAFTLSGAVAGFQSFSLVGNGNTCPYVIEHQTPGEWEVGIGTISAGPILTRTTLLSSSTGSPVNFSAGTKNVFLDVPAALTVLANTDDTLTWLGW